VVLVLLVGGSLWIVSTNAISMAIVPHLPILFLLLCLLSHELSPHMVSILSKSFGMITNPPPFFLGSREYYLRSNVESHWVMLLTTNLNVVALDQLSTILILATQFLIWSPASLKLFQKQFNFESFHGTVQREYIMYICIPMCWKWLIMI